jgi:acyl carrier protein
MTSNGRRDEIRERLNRVFQEVFDDDAIEIFEAMTAKDIEEWDSLMHITLVVAIETEFALRLNAAEVGELENVGRMMDLLEERASR